MTTTNNELQTGSNVTCLLARLKPMEPTMWTTGTFENRTFHEPLGEKHVEAMMGPTCAIFTPVFFFEHICNQWPIQFKQRDI